MFDLCGLYDCHSNVSQYYRLNSLKNLCICVIHKLQANIFSKYFNLHTESGILELKLKALILDIIHNIDVVKQLNQVQVHTTEDWAWKKQVRFYMKSDQTCYVQMVDSELQYTYEYQV